MLDDFEKAIINELILPLPGHNPCAMASVFEAFRVALLAALPPPQAQRFQTTLAHEIGKLLAPPA